MADGNWPILFNTLALLFAGVGAGIGKDSREGECLPDELKGLPWDATLDYHFPWQSFATGVGLVLYGYRNRSEELAHAPVGAGAFVRVAGRLRGLFREFF